MGERSVRAARGPLWLLGAAGLLWPLPVIGAAPFPGDELEDRQILFDIEEPPELDHRLGKRLSFGLSLDSEFIYEGDFDLDAAKGNDLAELTPELAVSFAFDLGPQAEIFAEIHLERAIDFRAPGDEPNPKTKLIVDELYLTLIDILPGLSLQGGRARIRDRREWLMDQELDGLRAFVRLQSFGLELAANRQQRLDEDLLNGDSITKIDNYMAVLRYRPDETFDSRAYILHRDNREQDADDLTFTGVQIITDWPEGGGLWLDAAYVFGRDVDAQVSGVGLDGGVTLVPDAPLGLSATFALAFGSGDGDSDDGRDHAFRQTGLQENRDAFNGVTRFRYYGEVLQPELSNLVVATAGVGILPGDHSSLDLVYHRYWQPESSDSLRASSIDADPDGRHRHLGDEIDLILGISEIEDVDIEAAVGAFLPGEAFTDDRDPAFVVRFEVTVEF